MTLVVTELTTIRLQTDGSTSFVQHSLPGISAYATKKNDCATREPARDYYVFMTALVDLRWRFEKRFWFSNLRNGDFTSQAQAFGREPNALPKLCNCLIHKNFGSPGRIRTPNISVNSRTTNLIELAGVGHNRRKSASCD